MFVTVVGPSLSNTGLSISPNLPNEQVLNLMNQLVDT